jgi:hypothetical protein
MPPQVGARRVALAKLLHVGAQAAAEGLFTQEVLEHTHNSAPFFVSDIVKKLGYLGSSLNMAVDWVSTFKSI